MNKPKIIQIEHGEGYDLWILLDNGKVFHRMDSGGPIWWKEEDYIKDIVEYFGKEVINN